VGSLKIGTIDSTRFIIKQIHKFQKKPEVKALLLKIQSPGGLPGTSQAIFNELKKFKEEKPVVVLVDDLCASGGYYVACMANQIIANPSSLVGSIGSKWVLPNIEKLLERFNVKVDEIKSGKYKTLLSMTRERTPEETQLLQELSDDTYQQFISDVAKERGLDIKDKAIWADGKIFTGNQALKLKLVDKLGSLSDAKEVITNLLVEKGVTVEGKIKLIHPRGPSPLSKLLGGEASEDEDQQSFSANAANLLSRIWNRFCTRLSSKTATLS
jgi:protease-4